MMPVDAVQGWDLPPVLWLDCVAADRLRMQAVVEVCSRVPSTPKTLNTHFTDNVSPASARVLSSTTHAMRCAARCDLSQTPPRRRPWPIPLARHGSHSYSIVLHARSSMTVDLTQPHPARIIIVGAGIVGAHLAQSLSTSPKLADHQIVVLDRSLTPLLGSTGHAPGFVGQLNSVPALCELAKRTVAAYRKVEGGFQVVGGLEVAETDEAVATLQERLALAHASGLEARIITPEEAQAAAPAFIDGRRTKAALFFPTDGTARADILTAAARTTAERHGAVFVEADVVDVASQDGQATGITSKTHGFIPASKVIITTGIWASETLPRLPVLPVAHPYIHSAPRNPLPGPPAPFVRWPAAHVYARDHGDNSGLGSYDHAPMSEDTLGSEAIGAWPTSFEQVLANACKHIPGGNKMFEGGKAFNGIFSTTPDNLPLVGKVAGMEGLWCAVAVWVTHAAASAELLSGLFTGVSREGDEELLKVLDPARFEGRDAKELRTLSLRAYNDIYNKEAQ